MTDYAELKLRAEHAVGFTDMSIAPDVILALLAENERLKESHEQICANYNRISYASEERGKQIEQLKAENEALRKALKPLLAHWDDLEPGESVYVDAARAALGNGEQS